MHAATSKALHSSPRLGPYEGSAESLPPEQGGWYVAVEPVVSKLGLGAILGPHGGLHPVATHRLVAIMRCASPQAGKASRVG